MRPDPEFWMSYQEASRFTGYTVGTLHTRVPHILDNSEMKRHKRKIYLLKEALIRKVGFNGE